MLMRASWRARLSVTASTSCATSAITGPSLAFPDRRHTVRPVHGTALRRRGHTGPSAPCPPDSVGDRRSAPQTGYTAIFTQFREAGRRPPSGSRARARSRRRQSGTPEQHDYRPVARLLSVVSHVRQLPAGPLDALDDLRGAADRAAEAGACRRDVIAVQEASSAFLHRPRGVRAGNAGLDVLDQSYKALLRQPGMDA